MKNRSVPREALRFTVGEFALGDNGENAKTAPLELKARSGQPIEHWYWGKVAHDLSGMRLAKPRIAVDYNHDPDQIVGYLNRFDISSGDLIASGALVPYKGDDRATEILFKAKQGVPYEASIFFGGDGIVVEEISEGESAQVNGYTLAGPAAVIREWPLRGVAITPYGADANTETRLSDGGDEVAVQFKQRENVMETEAEAAPVATVEAEAKVEGAEVAAPATVEAVVVEENLGQKFMTAFGETKGAVYFAKGISFEEAERNFHAEIRTERDALAAENTELKARLASIASTGIAPAATSAPAHEVPAGGAALAFGELVEKFVAERKVTRTEAMRQVAKEHPEAWKKQRAGK